MVLRVVPAVMSNLCCQASAQLMPDAASCACPQISHKVFLEARLSRTDCRVRYLQHSSYNRHDVYSYRALLWWASQRTSRHKVSAVAQSMQILPESSVSWKASLSTPSCRAVIFVVPRQEQQPPQAQIHEPAPEAPVSLCKQTSCLFVVSDFCRPDLTSPPCRWNLYKELLVLFSDLPATSLSHWQIQALQLWGGVFSLVYDLA